MRGARPRLQMENFHYNSNNKWGECEMNYLEGESSAEVLAFFNRLEEVANFAGWTQEQCLRAVAKYIRNAAVRCLLDNRYVKQIVEYEELKKLIFHFFVQGHKILQPGPQVGECVMGGNETVDSYVSRIICAVYRLYDRRERMDAAAEAFIDKVIRLEFISGLRGELKFEVTKKDPGTFSVARDIALRAEANNLERLGEYNRWQFELKGAHDQGYSDFRRPWQGQAINSIGSRVQARPAHQRDLQREQRRSFPAHLQWRNQEPETNCFKSNRDRHCRKLNGKAKVEESRFYPHPRDEWEFGSKNARSGYLQRDPTRKPLKRGEGPIPKTPRDIPHQRNFEGQEPPFLQSAAMSKRAHQDNETSGQAKPGHGVGDYLPNPSKLQNKQETDHKEISKEYTALRMQPTKQNANVEKKMVKSFQNVTKFDTPAIVEKQREGLITEEQTGKKMSLESGNKLQINDENF